MRNCFSLYASEKARLRLRFSAPGGVLLAALLCLISGCVSPGLTAVPGKPTLVGNPRFPQGEMEKLFTAAKWLKIRDMEYAAYVVLDAQVGSDGTVTLGRETESFPESSWDLLARALGQQARLHAATTGTHLEPQAEIFVVFFSPSVDGRLALVFGRQSDGISPGSPQRATCLFTTFY
jgi:hypothetical protein